MIREWGGVADLGACITTVRPRLVVAELVIVVLLLMMMVVIVVVVMVVAVVVDVLVIVMATTVCSIELTTATIALYHTV